MNVKVDNAGVPTAAALSMGKEDCDKITCNVEPTASSFNAISLKYIHVHVL